MDHGGQKTTHYRCTWCISVQKRKAWPPGDTHRPVKRLFTPEIKRMLKDWLVRRRENPYPNRDEKKLLAAETGLTYTQICNWFANWRRKLKNSGTDRQPVRKTWGSLIKNYNTNARGNVEQFSICSSDSIWGEVHGLGGGDHGDSRDSLTPDDSSGGEHEEDEQQQQQQQQQQHQQLLHHHRYRHRLGGVGYADPVAYLSYTAGDGIASYEPSGPYGAASAAHGQNNNSEQCHNQNLIHGGKYVEYVRLPEFDRVNERTQDGVSGSSPRVDMRETYPGGATFCFDHCYTPRNYETVFGIPEETRCYKVTQIDGKYVPEGGTTLEPLIITAATAYGHPVHTNGTLYLTPTTTLSPATTPHVPTGPGVPMVRSRSSKYKSSIMEKYLRDLGELEATEPDRTVMPVLMAAAAAAAATTTATIPFQQAHHHYHHHSAIEHERPHQHPPVPSPPPELQYNHHHLHQHRHEQHQHHHHHHEHVHAHGCEATVLRGPPSLSKWLESTAKFTPSKHNYIDWDNSGKPSANKKRCDSGGVYFGVTGGSQHAAGGDGTVTVGASGSTRDEYSPPSYGEETAVCVVPVGHQKDEIDAAEALTRLANNFRTKFTTS